MDEEIERLVVRVRADTTAFAKDVDAMRDQLDGPLASGMERAGLALERTLSRAIRRGSLDFEDLRRVALSVMNDIARSAIHSGLSAAFGGAGASGGGLLRIGASLLGAFAGAPGRATGGPVAPGRAYRVGEQGPELFVPASAGRVEPGAATVLSPHIRMTINISDHGQGSAPEQIRRSSRHIARSLRNALIAKAD